jgi:superfamily II DNA helicase RecQ
LANPDKIGSDKNRPIGAFWDLAFKGINRGPNVPRHIVASRRQAGNEPNWKDGLYPAQLKLIIRILDGEDMFYCMATGGGKSALFAVPIVVLKELAAHPELYADLPARALPVGIVVTPTKGLAANIVRLIQSSWTHVVYFQVFELSKLNVSALAYCQETLSEARIAGRNLVHEIRDCKTWSVICVDPEHLRDKAWRQITAWDVFRANIVYGCTDEATCHR